MKAFACPLIFARTHPHIEPEIEVHVPQVGIQSEEQVILGWGLMERVIGRPSEVFEEVARSLGRGAYAREDGGDLTRCYGFEPVLNSGSVRVWSAGWDVRRP